MQLVCFFSRTKLQSVFSDLNIAARPNFNKFYHGSVLNVQFENQANRGVLTVVMKIRGQFRCILQFRCFVTHVFSSLLYTKHHGRVLQFSTILFMFAVG